MLVFQSQSNTSRLRAMGDGTVAAVAGGRLACRAARSNWEYVTQIPLWCGFIRENAFRSFTRSVGGASVAEIVVSYLFPWSKLPSEKS